MALRGTTLLHRIKKCPVHLVVRITAPPAFCYLPYVIRLSQKELQDQFKESFCCLAPSGSSLDRNNPFTSSLQRLSKVLNFCIIVSFALSFVKPKVGKKTACRQSEYKTQKTAPGKLPKAVFVQSLYHLFELPDAYLSFSWICGVGAPVHYSLPDHTPS